MFEFHFNHSAMAYKSMFKFKKSGRKIFAWYWSTCRGMHCSLLIVKADNAHAICACMMHDVDVAMLMMMRYVLCSSRHVLIASCALSCIWKENIPYTHINWNTEYILNGIFQHNKSIWNIKLARLFVHFVGSLNLVQFYDANCGLPYALHLYYLDSLIACSMFCCIYMQVRAHTHTRTSSCDPGKQLHRCLRPSAKMIFVSVCSTERPRTGNSRAKKKNVHEKRLRPGKIICPSRKSHWFDLTMCTAIRQYSG